MLVRVHREHRDLTQDAVAAECGTNRTAVAHLEQGIRLPKPDSLSSICSFLQMPEPLWAPYTRERSLRRFDFEDVLGGLVGRSVSIDVHDDAAEATVEARIADLFDQNPSDQQLFDHFNSVLVYYGVGPVSWSFFHQYWGPASFGSLKAFSGAVDRFQMDAIRLFSTFSEAFGVLSGPGDLDALLEPLQPRDLKPFQDRSEWSAIEEIEEDLLPDLGYISAKRVRQEAAERAWLIEQLNQLASQMGAGNGRASIDALGTKVRRKIDSLLRKFDSTIRHGVSSPLFSPDADELLREAARLAPKTEEELERMEATQQRVLRNLSAYLAADHMDLYVATSMRSSADYVSVNHFVKHLFRHELIRPLKLRYFNPTQSWIDDRVAKGLVEALMLKRASVTIYMAQKGDTFGKDSEASVALGQGKPVIVYVPKLVVGDKRVDVERLYATSRGELVSLLEQSGDQDELDDTIDDEALVGRLLKRKLEGAPDEEIVEAVRALWADFDLYAETDRFQAKNAKLFRQWLDSIVEDESVMSIPPGLRDELLGTLVATAINFEKRAKVFREVHPLALQVILSSGVLNGILVARSVEQCATVLNALIRNELDLEMTKDADNHRVIERNTGSTIRVISRHQLLKNAFRAHYRRRAAATGRAGGL